MSTLRTAFQLVQARAPAIVTTSSMALLPAMLAHLGVTAIAAQSGGPIAPIFASILGSAIMAGGMFFAQAALVPLVAENALVGTAGPREAWLAVGRRFGPLLRTGVPMMLLVWLGTLCCVLPGLYASVIYAFALPVAALEPLEGMAALRRSKELVGTVLGSVIAVLALSFAINFSAQLVATLLVGRAEPLFLVLVQDLVLLAAWPVLITAQVLNYQLARVRLEGATPEELAGEAVDATEADD
jgi:hypothetical protein